MRSAATAMLLLAISALPAAAGESHLPPGLRDIQDFDAFKQAIERELESRLGSEFPNWDLRGEAGRTKLHSVSAGPIIVLYGGGPCPAFLDKVREAEAGGWTRSDGTLVVILKNKRAFRDELVRKALKGSDKAYYLRRWDKRGLMNYLRIYPTYLLIDAERRLVDFKVGSGEWYRTNDSE